MEERHERIHDAIQRLSRIEGHIRGVKNMLEERKKCEDIIIQLSAVQAALKKVNFIILEDHLEHCIINSIKEDETKNKNILKDFSNALRQVMKL